jgi:CubicO group peptidase (beta-lactamase class C family)
MMTVSAGATDFKPRIDPIVQPVIEKQQYVGIGVGVITPDERQVFGYGTKKIDSGTTPNGQTVFEIGSITKVFTTLVLADMVQKGELRLDDPIRLHLPAGMKLPTRGGKEIRLVDLATHRSGLPRLPPNFWWQEIRSEENPYSGYTPAMLQKFLANHELQRNIGERFVYSNLGVGLLGYILAQKLGTSYEEMVLRRVCRPLGLKDTCISLSATQRERLAWPYAGYGRPASNWDFDALAGCGALRSTADDMLTFLAANLGLVTTDLLPAMQLCHEPRADTDRPGQKIGLGWHIEPPVGEAGDKFVVPLSGGSGAVHWHNGGTGGYHSYAGFMQESRTGVVVLTNTSRGIEEIALRILREVLNRKSPESRIPDGK